MTLEKGYGQSRQAALLLLVHGFFRAADILRLSRFYLDKHDRAVVEHHEIELARARAVASGEYFIAAASKVAGGSVFAALAEGFSWKYAVHPSAESFLGEKTSDPIGNDLPEIHRKSDRVKMVEK